MENEPPNPLPCKVCGCAGVVNKRKSNVNGAWTRLQYCSLHWGEKVSNTFRLKRGENLADPKRSFKTPDGYIYIPVGRVYIFEHKFVMEKKLGRKLRKGESVHHINGIRDDNRPDNLELWLSAPRYGQRATDLTCPHCGKTYN